MTSWPISDDADLLVRPLLEEGLDLLHDLLELADLDGPFFAGLHHAPEELLAVVGLARAVLLDDHVGDLFDLLVGREAALAGEALPAPADGQAFFALPGIDDLAFQEAADRDISWLVALSHLLDLKEG